MISAIILSHNKEREKNLRIIVDSLLKGTVKPDNIVIFVDNPDITYYDNRVTIVTSTKRYPVISRFALGLCEKSDRILMIDDDLRVGKTTLANFAKWSEKYPEALLGLEGNILHSGSVDCYTNGLSIDRGSKEHEVDIIIRTYFATPLHLVQALYTRELFKDQLPETSIDDIILCMSNKYQYNGKNIVIPIDQMSDVVELNTGDVGQCLDSEHYRNRNYTSQILR